MTIVTTYGVEPFKIEPLVSSFGVTTPGPRNIWVPYFDGVDNEVVVDGKFIDITGDIDFEFEYVGNAVNANRAVYSQGTSATGAVTGIEFRVQFTLTALNIVVGGVASNFTYPITGSCKVRVTLVGTVVTWYINGASVGTASLTRGAVVSADPNSYVGRNTPGIALQNRMLGSVFNIVANGTEFPLHGNQVASYESVPAGFTGTPLGFTSADYRLVEVS